MPEKINPYIAGAPVLETRMFFGREDVFSWIERSLSGKFVDHILVLHGQRRVGKTSVLKHISHRLPKDYIPIFIDLQGRVNTTLPRFLWWLAREITRALEMPEPERENFESDAEFFETGFLPQVEEKLGDKVLLLTFDEFDTLESTTAQEGLALPFMAILKHLMDHKKLNFIFSIGSSGRKLENMQAAYTSFFKQALYRKISFLDEHDARDLISKPVEGVMSYDLDAVDYIYEITSGHPYFIQLICHELFSVSQKSGIWTVGKADVEGVLDAVIERGTVNLKFVWDEASELEKWVLAALSQFDRGADLSEIEKLLKKYKVRYIRQDLESALLHLREKDVLASGNRYMIHLMKLWLVQNRSLEQVREELNKVNPIVSQLLQVGHEYLDQGETQKAIDAFKEALLAEEDNYDVRMGLAGAYIAREDYGRAAVEYEEILTLFPEDVAAQAGFCESYISLGDSRFALGRLDESEYAYQQALKINPRHMDGCRRMARLYHHRAVIAISGKENIALEQVRKALEYTPDDVGLQASVVDLEALSDGKREMKDVLLAWGRRAGENHNWQDAADLLEAYQRLESGDQKVTEVLKDINTQARIEQLEKLRLQAQRMERLGEYDEAIIALEKYLELKPEDANEIPSHLERLKIERKQTRTAERKAEEKPFWRRPVTWVGFVALAIVAILVANPSSPLRLALVQPTPESVVEKRIVVATQAPTDAPTPTPAPLPYQWKRVTSVQFLERDQIQAVEIHPNDADIIYVGTRSSGVYKSNDGGLSWLPVNNGITGREIDQIIIDPQEPDIVYAGVFGLGVFKTENGGDSWLWLDTQLPEAKWKISNLAMNSSDSSHLVYTNGSGISESHDHGETWKKLELSFSNPGLVVIDPDTGNLIVAAGDEYSNEEEPVRIYLSDDQRSNWQLTLEEFPRHPLSYKFFVFDQVRNRFFLSAGDGWISDDGGRTWKIFGDQETLAMTLEGRYITADGGTPTIKFDSKFEKRITNVNISITCIDVALNDSNRIVVGSLDGVWVTDNGGDKWYKRVNGLGAVVSSFGFDSNIPSIYIGQYTEPVYPNNSNQPAGIGNFYSYDLTEKSYREISKSICGAYQTQPWEQAACHEYRAYMQEIKGSPIYLYAWLDDPKNTSTVYIGTDNGAYLSTDGGENWGAINEGFGDMRIVYDLAFDPQNPDNLYALTPYGIYILEEK